MTPMRRPHGQPVPVRGLLAVPHPSAPRAVTSGRPNSGRQLMSAGAAVQESFRATAGSRARIEPSP